MLLAGRAVRARAEGAAGVTDFSAAILAARLRRAARPTIASPSSIPKLRKDGEGTDPVMVEVVVGHPQYVGSGGRLGREHARLRLRRCRQDWPPELIS